MGKIEKYEDLRCWQQARELVNKIYELIEEPEINKEFGLSDQLKRASISVMTNIAEGFSRYHKGDFIRFLDYAQSSAQEVKSLLYIVADQQLVDIEEVDEIQDQCDYCQALILALIKHIKDSRSQEDRANESKVYYMTEELIVD